MTVRLRIAWLALAVIGAWVLPMRCIEIYTAQVAYQAKAETSFTQSLAVAATTTQETRRNE
ncbi:hypothetical protein [Xanthomonas citri]|uniref:hypothetical protein n=1 Tax=Xanthomonas citri TaxID=346 RepID=UPI0005B44EC2|nr:hypothetical protein [Xanthomonas citri]AMV00081.1 hypothetical protein TP37_19880 [Xanthomonas citri pv. aurantifolii]AMV02094.1 hypothetical protein TP50_06250 [Xanthomonas citri pv. aurantifolii]MCC8490860.1 hypothetical protein [Xanthomonas citri pv. fuscans]TBW97972.1 hypothetical protein TP47_09620 [Xanthomonas citri pv. aurantifolii]TBW99288.1 hypothetical protein TP49_04480 [Xanthomonas citri pv. aurantifolii]